MLNIDNYLYHLEKLVNIESDSRNKEGIKELINYIIGLMKPHGFNIVIEEMDYGHGPCVCISNGVPKYDILLLAHSDTAFPKEITKDWKFSKDELKAYGPAVADMKSGLLSICMGMIQLKQENRLPNVCFAINSNEELGSIVSREWITDLAEKSKCSLVFEMGRANGEFVKQRKGWGNISVNFTGEAIHSSRYPSEGKNSIVEAAKWIVELDKLNSVELGTTVSTGLINGGSAVNTVPDKTSIDINIRYTTNKEKNRIFAKIKELESFSNDNGIHTEVKVPSFSPPMLPTEKTEIMAKLTEQLGKKLGIDVEWLFTAGGSDGNIVADSGIPVIDALGPVGDFGHTKDEFILLNTIEPRYNLLVELIKELPSYVSEF